MLWLKAFLKPLNTNGSTDSNSLLTLNYMNLLKTILINWCNTERLHSSLEYLAALELELKLKGFINKAA